MIKRLIPVLVMAVVFPCIATAEVNTDIRFKFGRAAEADRFEIDSASTDGSGGVNNSNTQVEAVLSPGWDSPVGFVIGVGIFNRSHSGDFDLGTHATNVKYTATGVSFAPGIRIKANEHLSFEGKFEIGISPSGNVEMSSPDVIWNNTKSGTYTSTSLLFGAYYAFSKPGLLVGVELGIQSFEGDFQIWNNGGYYSDGKVTGTSGVANVMLGVRF